MNLSALYNDYEHNTIDKYQNLNNFLAAGLLYVIGHYFSNWSSYFVMTVCCRNNQTCNFYNDMFDKMFAEWKEWPIQIMIVNRTDYQEMKEAHQYNIVFTDCYESFLKTEIHNNTAKYNKNEYYFIHLHTRDNLAKDEMRKIFQHCWENYLINCIVQIQKKNGQVLIFTYFPFTEKFCGQVEAVLVNEYNGTSMIRENIFPKKLKNFYGCPLRAALYHVPPYVYLSKDSKNVTYVAGGFEGKLLLELSRILNFSLDIIVSENATKHGTVTHSTSITRALKMLQNRQADISLGATRQTEERMEYLSSTMHYYQTFWGIMILNEAYILTSLETLLFPFKNDTWYLLASICIFIFIIVALLKFTLPKNRLKQLDYVNLDIYSITLGMPACSKAIFNTTRILKATWIIFSLILRTFYQALLFHYIRTHIVRNTPQTIKDLINQNYSLIVDQNTFYGLKDIDIFKEMNINVKNTTDRELPLAYLEKLPVDEARHMAVALPIIRFQYYILTNQKTEVFRVLPQYIMHVKLCMYLAKRSFLTEQFDDILTMIKGFGIVHAWVNQEIDISYIKEANPVANQILDLKTLKVAFLLLLVGHMIATAVLIIELSYQRFKMFRRSKIFKNVKFVKNV